MSSTPLPISTPGAQGVDARGVEAFLDALDASPEIEVHGVVVLRHGHVVAQGWWSPYAAERVHLVYSLSKSFTAAALGLAVDEGLVDLDTPVVAHFPEMDADITDPRSRAITLRHLAAMASGHAGETWEPAVVLDPAEPVRGFLKLAPEAEPGSVFAYNQSCTYALAAVLQRASGQTLTEYLRPRLFEPLGIGAAAWQQHPAGRDAGFTGLHVTTDAVARLGQLLLQGGVWEGRQVLPAAWVAEATRRHVDTPDAAEVDSRQGYGYQFWMSRHGYRGDGAFGQLCLVLPECDAVVAVTGGSTRPQALLDAAWEHLLPALGGGPAPDATADDALARRTAALALPPVLHPDTDDPPAWRGAAFSPVDGECPGQPGLSAIGVRAAECGWELTLTEAGEPLIARLGIGGWAVTDAASGDGGSVPVAISGGGSAEKVLRFDVLFLETPHRLAVTCWAETTTFEATWVTAPLWPSALADLRAPV
ncbi:MAG: Beta-lactamase class C-like and penicillin binding proteins (PBPs) superfamily [uncultured Quadrisphaera sp.]|uniref:Beta-lactamase class C-like and penicillin binding proteins (PBPs) superfamily n=1 Tax=uncultured Quadrisphaera sp. TaxID=904978 RepID=A0A6J4NUA9_9ACTN|nr:MAG: Beta-lactamase class C-like and penicillin binding proteins (PBPs) superfamily [uncultured Quadrisphaera sp.]